MSPSACCSSTHLLPLNSMEKRFLLAEHFVALTAVHGVGRYWWTWPNQSKTQWRFPSRIFHNVNWNQLERKLRHKKEKYWKSWYARDWCQSHLHPRQCHVHQTAFHDVHIAQPNYFLFIYFLFKLCTIYVHSLKSESEILHVMYSRHWTKKYPWGCSEGLRNWRPVLFIKVWDG